MKTIATNDFGKLIFYVNKFDTKVRENSEKLMMELGKIYKDILIDVITEQPDSWPELSEEWLSWKERNISKGISLEKWIAKGDLLNSIEVKVSGNGIFVGFGNKVHRSSTRKLNSKITMGRLARVLEKGFEAKNIPPRPLFAEADKRFEKILKEKFKEYSRKITLGMIQ